MFLEAVQIAKAAPSGLRLMLLAQAKVLQVLLYQADKVFQPRAHGPHRQERLPPHLSACHGWRRI